MGPPCSPLPREVEGVTVRGPVDGDVRFNVAEFPGLIGHAGLGGS